MNFCVAVVNHGSDAIRDVGRSELYNHQREHGFEGVRNIASEK